MKKTRSYRDFPPTMETDKLRLWKLDNLDLTPSEENKYKNTSLNVDIKTQDIYQTIAYPFKDNSGDLLKILVLQFKQSTDLSISFKTNRITTQPRIIKFSEYQDFVSNLEKDLFHVIDTTRKQITYKEDYQKTY